MESPCSSVMLCCIKPSVFLLCRYPPMGILFGFIILNSLLRIIQRSVSTLNIVRFYFLLFIVQSAISIPSFISLSRCLSDVTMPSFNCVRISDGSVMPFSFTIWLSNAVPIILAKPCYSMACAICCLYNYFFISLSKTVKITTGQYPLKIKVANKSRSDWFIFYVR